MCVCVQVQPLVAHVETTQKICYQLSIGSHTLRFNPREHQVETTALPSDQLLSYNPLAVGLVAQFSITKCDTEWSCEEEPGQSDATSVYEVGCTDS